PRSGGFDPLDLARRLPADEDVFVRARKDDLSVLRVAEERERDVFVRSQATVDVVVHYGVQECDELCRSRVWPRCGDAGQSALDHQHDEAGIEAVTGDVADDQPRAVGPREDVVVIAAYVL